MCESTRKDQKRGEERAREDQKRGRKARGETHVEGGEVLGESFSCDHPPIVSTPLADAIDPELQAIGEEEQDLTHRQHILAQGRHLSPVVSRLTPKSRDARGRFQ